MNVNVLGGFIASFYFPSGDFRRIIAYAIIGSSILTFMGESTRKVCGVKVNCLHPIFKRLPFLVKGILFLIFAAPGLIFLITPTVMGSFTVLMGALMYIAAHMAEEERAS